MAQMTWDNPPADAWTSLADAYVNRIRIEVRNLVDYYAGVMEQWMKINAGWTDRTGNARQTLSAQVEAISRDMMEIILAGGVDYFIWLELANAGRFAIIGPALDYFGPLLWADLRRILS